MQPGPPRVQVLLGEVKTRPYPLYPLPGLGSIHTRVKHIRSCLIWEDGEERGGKRRDMEKNYSED